MAVHYVGNESFTKVYTYDFDVDGGASGGGVNLSAKADGPGLLPLGAIVTDVVAIAQEALVGPTGGLQIGDGDSTSVYGSAPTANLNAIYEGYQPQQNVRVVTHDTASRSIWVETSGSAATAGVIKIIVCGFVLSDRLGL